MTFETILKYKEIIVKYKDAGIKRNPLGGVSESLGPVEMPAYAPILVTHEPYRLRVSGLLQKFLTSPNNDTMLLLGMFRIRQGA